MERRDRITYWVERFGTDSQQLNDQQRISLVKAVLVNHCLLTPTELSVFLDPEFSPSPTAMDETFTYAQAERKIADYYNAEFPKFGTGEYAQREKQHKAFQNDFRTALQGFYKKGEIDEILSFGTIHDDSFIAQSLIGKDFYAVRRIRNAYIPGMITSLRLIKDEEGRTVESQDVTHTLFDTGEDAVSQLERSLGIDPTEK